MRKMKKLAGFLAALMVASMLVVPAMAEEPSMYAPPVVETEKGALRGLYEEGTYAFLGIPYASTPERFGLPGEVEAWEGVRSAQAFGPVAPIPKQTNVGGDELVWPHRYWIQNEAACQNLNIWTQSLDAEAKRPVLVFFHGGGFNNGSSIEGAAYDGANLSAYGDVVVVTVNHRLNALGFLNLEAYGEEYKYSKVAGLADLVASLQWVHDNIEIFGGDPGNVTIFGQSGGGRKVQAMLHAPSAEGLVQHAIIMSSQDSTGVPSEGTQALAARTMEILGVEDVAGLQAAPVDDLIAAAAQGISELRSEYSGLNWGLNYDDDFLMTEYCDWAADVDVMVSYVFSENTHPSYSYADGRKNEWNEEELQYWLNDRYGEDADAAVEEFQKVFPEKPIQDAVFFDGSKLKTAAVILQERIESGATAPVYNYIFDYEAPVNGGTTAFHCVDLIYVFHNVELPIVTRATGGAGNEEALAMQDTVATAIINFATTGDPSQEGLEWKPYTLEEKNVMVFDVNSECRVLGGETLADLATK